MKINKPLKPIMETPLFLVWTKGRFSEVAFMGNPHPTISLVDQNYLVQSAIHVTGCATLKINFMNFKLLTIEVNVIVCKIRDK